jgi:transcription initiation factor TFIIIB Brf1 subunit/transcription initiation factor TFIIB
MTQTQDPYDSIWSQLETLKEVIPDIQKVCCENVEPYESKESLVCLNCGKVLDILISAESGMQFTSESGSKVDTLCTGPALDPLMKSLAMSSCLVKGNAFLNKLIIQSNNESVSYTDKTLLQFSYKIKDIVARHNLTSDIVYAFLYNFKNIIEHNSVYRGKNYIGLVAVCFYHTCKNLSHNLHPITVCSYFDIPIKNFNKSFKIYNEIMAASSDNIIIEQNVKQTTRRILYNINIPMNVITLSEKILIALECLGISIKLSPQSVIGGLIQFLNVKLNLKIDIKDIVNHSKSKESTIKKTSSLFLQEQVKIYNYIKYYM